ncbi:50S ribosomal protein L25 [Candidatus Falkowbacteria bacterium HGW-Falkowbacteria-1]|uniref:Large ribosomal subunit protein bL25 n=1 Tax=Candidatus Falkowbacteria bacterium HGW-Falkowbacteria-1 TaxID=2013768 RepID=A0A2N2E9Q8_9BACT|nr:MAG: 50S ribosomal protein L25 [Candidatus Falkowbacteria bacterium HGW-Falkowbacteria-1]
MKIELKAETREKKEKLDKKFVAAVIYGSGVESKSLKLKLNDFLKVYNLAGESNLIELELEGKKESVLVKDIQKNPVKGFITHVDFYQVDMAKTITTDIPLEFVGESKAVKELGGMLIKNIDSLSVECLPGDLTDHVSVDISVLSELGGAIYVKDIKISEKIKVLNHANDPVITVVEPREEKVETPAELPKVEAIKQEDKKDEKASEGDKK